jgi:hypothetical protein
MKCCWVFTGRWLIPFKIAAATAAIVEGWSRRCRSNWWRNGHALKILTSISRLQLKKWDINTNEQNLQIYLYFCIRSSCISASLALILPIISSAPSVCARKNHSDVLHTYGDKYGIRWKTLIIVLKKENVSSFNITFNL